VFARVWWLFAQASVSRLPCLRYGDDIIADPDEMVLYIDATFRYPPMPYDNVAAARACRDVFSRFSFYVKVRRVSGGVPRTGEKRGWGLSPLRQGLVLCVGVYVL